MLRINSLTISFPRSHPHSPTPVVRNVSLSIAPGELVAVVGESGSGKSLTALAVLGLLPPPPSGAAIDHGSITFTDPLTGHVTELANASEATLRKIRGGRIAMIFQEPMTSLNPVFTVGEQIIEAIALHRREIASNARNAEAELALARVGVSEPARRLTQYPHELSGGLRQRVMIAMAVACRPALLIADEPTTALDATVQSQVLDVIDGLRKKGSEGGGGGGGMGVLLITHDLGIAHRRADRVVVMRQGEVVEEGPAHEVITNPTHPYTKALLACRPDRAKPGTRLPTVADFMNASTTPAAS